MLIYIMYHAFLFSEGFGAACRLPPWHEGTSINYGTGHKGLKTYVSEDKINFSPYVVGGWQLQLVGL